ncbi:MAG: ABC transporter permease subunit [Spirochaetales bacterium]|nr:ABC transporter permease subunit [Spirochaetales bacterium]
MKRKPLFRINDKIPIIPILLLILLIGIAPFITAFGDSFFHDYYGERSFAGLENFRFILGDTAFTYSLNITVIWALLNVVLSLFFGFLLALKLVGSGEGSKKRDMLHHFLLIPWGIPVYIAIPLWRAFLHGNGGESVITRLTGLQINLMTDPLSGFLGALMVSLWLSIPLSAFVFAGHMRKVSRQVIEAARIDGAGMGEIAIHIYIPEIRESLLAMGVLNFIKAFKEFTLVFMMTAGGPPLISGITERHIVGATTTLGVFLYEVFLQTNDWGINAAYALIMAGLVIFIMLIWIFIKRRASVRFFLFISALLLLPGGNPVLWSFAGAYLLFGIAGGVIDKKAGRVRIKIHIGFGWLTLVHLIYTIIEIAIHGFLTGFHPGILIPILTLLFRSAERRRTKPFQSIPEYRWKGLGFRKFIPVRGVGGGANLVSISFIGISLIILYMLIWMSLSRISACYMDSLLPGMATMDNFRRIFVEESILKYFLNTFIVAGVTAIFLPFIIFPGAVRLSKWGKKRTLTFLGFIQIIGIAGGMHTLIPLYSLFRNLGLINTYIPLILIYLYHSIPFALFILTAYLESLPASFRDLAKLEGMGDLTYGFKILLPLSLPPLITAVMTAFIAGWNGFQAPLLFLNDEALYTISLKLYSYVGNLGSGSPVWNTFAAVSVVNTLFIGFLFIRFKKPMGYSPVSEVEE